MSSPVMIDDGGCTRVKQLKNNTTMDHLIDLFHDKSSDPFVDGKGAFSCVMKVIRHDDFTADHHVVPPEGQILSPTDNIVIVSTNGQQVVLEFDSDYRMSIKLAGTSAGVLPVVEAKQDLCRRRYEVINAGVIKTVTVNPGDGIHPLFDLAATPSIYTMVHFIET